MTNLLMAGEEMKPMNPQTSTYPPAPRLYRKATGILDRLLSFIALCILALVLFPVMILYVLMLVTVGTAMAFVNLWEAAKLAEARAATLALFLLCASAYAAPLPPFPTTTVKRPVPLLSPKAASVPKSTPMFRTASENPPVPMLVGFQPASGGRVTLIVDALKPANTTMQFDYGPTPTGPWSMLMCWDVYPESQWVGVAWTPPSSDTMFVRAKHGTPGATLSSRMAEGEHHPEGVIKLPSSKRKPVR